MARSASCLPFGSAFGLSLAIFAAHPAFSEMTTTFPVTLRSVGSPGSAVPIDLSAALRGTVFVFLSARCPCSRGHEDSLRALAREFGPAGFAFVGIHANADESPEEAGSHFAAADLGFPIARDEGRLAETFGALKTPHAFVLDGKGRVLFSGGVDDSKDAKRASRHYLRDALQDLAANRAPRVSAARTLGCMIKRKGES